MFGTVKANLLLATKLNLLSETVVLGSNAECITSYWKVCTGRQENTKSTDRIKVSGEETEREQSTEYRGKKKTHQKTTPIMSILAIYRGL